MKIAGSLKMIALAGTAAVALAAPGSAAKIVLNDVGTATTYNALNGFRIAAAYWESQLANDVTIRLNIGLDKLPKDVLGSTGSRFTSAATQTIYSRLTANSSSALDAQAVANLSPLVTSSTYGVGGVNVFTPGYTGADADGNPYGIDNSTKVYDTDGSYNNVVLGLTRANAKALGLLADDGDRDATITFSSEFRFDYDASDGIAANRIDFVGVAIHEIGHALGFVSGVDDYDFFGTGGPVADEVCFPDGTLCKDYPANDDWFGETLDLFRYSAPGALDWTTNTASYFSLDGGASAFQGDYFSTGAFNGNGDQASHWLAPQVSPFCSNFVGVMNPYLCYSTEAKVTANDLAAFDAIGWNVRTDVLGNPRYVFSSGDAYNAFAPVPEAATWLQMIMGFGVIGGAARVARRKVSFA